MDNLPTESNDISTSVEASVPAPPMPSHVQSRSNALAAKHDLHDIMQRWIKTKRTTWTPDSPLLSSQLPLSDYLADTQRYLEQFALPQDLFDNSPLLVEKANNFMLMRADVAVEVKVNAEPFQQGALLMAYFPRSLNTTKFRSKGNEFLGAVSSAPHKVLFIEQGNKMELIVPYAHIKDYIDLTNLDDTFGYINLYVLSPLVGATSVEKAEITTRMRFVNIDLRVATDNSISNTLRYAEKSLQQAQDRVNQISTRGFYAQASEGEKKGPITKLSSALADVADVASLIPGVGSFAAATGWFFRMVNKVAAVYGWSKPINQDKPTPMYQKPAAFMGNTEGPDSSFVLGQINDNSVNTTSFVPSGQDEMSHEFIFSRPNYIETTTVSKTSWSESKLLFGFEVSPINSLVAQTDSNGQDFALGAQAFTTALYKLWRGTIDYSFELVKTKYHAGRFIAIYFPNRKRSELPSTFDQAMQTNHSMIYDLQAKEDDEMSLARPFSVPYTSASPFKKVLHKNAAGQYDTTTLETHIGVIGVYSYNALVAPDTVADRVTFVLKQSFRSKGEGTMQLGIPQISICGGFATRGTPVLPETEILNLLNRLYNNSVNAMQCLADIAGATPTLYDNDSVFSAALIQDSAASQWVRANLEAINLVDGVYTVSFNYTTNFAYFTPETLTFTVTVSGEKIVTITSTPMLALNGALAVNIQDILFQFSIPTPFVAQVDSGASDPMVTKDIGQSKDDGQRILLGTMGEYSKSLRPLIKRFVHTRDIRTREAVSFTPADFINYDSAVAATLPIGNRAWSDGSYRALVPESWLNLVSYLYRFCAGSVSQKVFIGAADRATTSLNVTDQLVTEFGKPESDPSFVQEGVINNALEVRVPYYGQNRARVIGDQARGLTAKSNISIAGRGTKSCYEAAGDDFNMWFMVGPPIMRPIDVNPVSIPTISSNSVERQRTLNRLSSIVG